MCRAREFERRRKSSSLKIESVGLELKKASGGGGVEEAEWVSLVLMPRIDGSPVVVNGSEVAPDIPIFITLHRVTSRGGEALFLSRKDRVEGWPDGLTFELHFGQYRLLRGIFRRSCKTNMTNGGWKMECKWVGHPEIGGLLGIREAVLCVGLDWDGSSDVLTERLVVEDIHVNNDCRRRRWRNKCGSFHKCLPDIPEVLDEDEDEEDDEQDDQGWHCNCNCNKTNKYEDEMKMEDYTWAVDASFWAVCAGLGLGFVLSHTSNKTFCLSKFLPL